MAGASPRTRLSTPAGSPASSASTASASAESGVSSAGLRTTVQPAASAGATLRVTIASGKFHGVIAATTPTGPRSVHHRIVGGRPGLEIGGESSRENGCQYVENSVV